MFIRQERGETRIAGEGQLAGRNEIAMVGVLNTYRSTDMLHIDYCINALFMRLSEAKVGESEASSVRSSLASASCKTVSPSTILCRILRKSLATVHKC